MYVCKYETFTHIGAWSVRDLTFDVSGQNLCVWWCDIGNGMNDDVTYVYVRDPKFDVSGQNFYIIANDDVTYVYDDVT